MALVGVIPAAGYASRLQPLSGSKEVFPIKGRPIMDYLVERMLEPGPSELRVVTRPEKTDVVACAARHGATVVEGHPASVAESVLLGMAGLTDEDVLLLGYPDTIWEPVDGYSTLVDLVEDGFAVALGIFEAAEPERSDVVTVSESGIVEGIQPKPMSPASNRIWGCAAARVGALRGLERNQEPGAYIDSLCKDGRVVGSWMSDAWIDIGTPRGLRHALA